MGVAIGAAVHNSGSARQQQSTFCDNCSTGAVEDLADKINARALDEESLSVEVKQTKPLPLEQEAFTCSPDCR
jgi:hypothetical protein